MHHPDAPLQLDAERPLPRHIAIIMDGNGRWARQRGLPRHAGHREGVKAVRSAVEQCRLLGVEVLTLFAFSSENWKRPQQEVGLLMELFMSALRKEVRRLRRNGIRLRVIGERSAFGPRLQQQMVEAERATAAAEGMILQVAANYGGRWDIVQAARQLAVALAAGELRAEQLDEARLGAALSFADLPNPDLLIRTGGEQRISNFMLWQAAYSELYFTSILWPDFDQAALLAAVVDFQQRQRRFGLTGEQVVSASSLSDGGGGQ